VFANAQIYFDTVAKPQYDAFLQNPSPSTCWGAVVSMHHITDYHVRDHRGSNVLHNHADAIAAIDFCVVPTLTFECLFAFLVVDHGRRQLLWFAVTRHPTAEWLAQQIVEAFPWGTTPTYLVRDNDGAYGQAFTRRVRAMGIRDRPISPRSPWQNPYVERLIGTLRRDCLDHILIFGERHLRRVPDFVFALLQ
jgi:transposase InsO family protein